MILLSKPIPMKKIYVAFPKEYSDEVASLLHEAGVLHIEQGEQARILEEYEALTKIREEIINLISRVRGIRIEAELRALEAASLTIEKIKSDVASILSKVNEIESQISKHREDYEKMRLFEKVLSSVPRDLEPRTFYYEGRRISSVLLIGKIEVVENLKKLPYIKTFNEYLVDGETAAILVYLESQELKRLLDSARSYGAVYPSGALLKYLAESKSIDEFKNSLLSNLTEIENKIKSLRDSLEKTIKENTWLLGKYLLFVDNNLQKYSALTSFQDLKHLTVLTGWVPETCLNELRSKLGESSVPLYFEYKDPDPDDNPPTLMRNPPVIRFYQLITKLYGIPGYFERDPTPVIAYSFALFFGLMNADFGYALVGILGALLLLDKMVDDPKSPAFREFKGVVLASNTVALILGILSGSIFGDVLQRFFGFNLPVLLSSIINPLDFIKLSLVIGLIHVNVAHVLTAIKLVKEKRKGDLLIEVGLFTAEIFGIPYILYEFFRYSVPFIGTLSSGILLSGTMLGVALIIVGSLITMRFLGAIMWLFQITGLLGDVLSYVRLAGVGLATYYMALIFNFILELMARGLAQVNPFLSIVVVAPFALLAHLMVTILSQLGAFVHSMRLCILEFLSKFYDGNGYEYNPLRVVNRAVLVLK